MRPATYKDFILSLFLPCHCMLSCQGKKYQDQGQNRNQTAQFTKLANHTFNSFLVDYIPTKHRTNAPSSLLHLVEELAPKGTRKDFNKCLYGFPVTEKLCSKSWLFTFSQKSGNFSRNFFYGNVCSLAGVSVLYLHIAFFQASLPDDNLNRDS